MHRKQDSDLFLADTELERTLRSLRKTKRAENVAMVDERHDQTEEQRTAVGRPPITDTMEDFWRPIIQEEYSAIRQPTMDANNFELKPSLIKWCSSISSLVTPPKTQTSTWVDFSGWQI